MLDVFTSFGAAPIVLDILKRSPLLDAMPPPAIYYDTDWLTGSALLSGATYLLQRSLTKIGFVKRGDYVVCFDDEKTPEYIRHNLQTLANLRGWELVIGPPPEHQR